MSLLTDTIQELYDEDVKYRRDWVELRRALNRREISDGKPDVITKKRRPGYKREQRFLALATKYVPQDALDELVGDAEKHAAIRLEVTAQLRSAAGDAKLELLADAYEMETLRGIYEAKGRTLDDQFFAQEESETRAPSMVKLRDVDNAGSKYSPKQVGAAIRKLKRIQNKEA